MTIVGRAAQLNRFPVKSLRGERLDRVEVDVRGVLADRRWALREPDDKLGSGKSTRRFRAMPGLLDLRARLDGYEPVVAFPDGRTLRPGKALDDALSTHVGRQVRLAEEDDIAHHDAAAVHLVTDASCRMVDADPSTLRANLVLLTDHHAGPVEDGWVGRPETLRTVASRNGLQLGVYAEVLRTGVVRTGDEVRLVSIAAGPGASSRPAAGAPAKSL